MGPPSEPCPPGWHFFRESCYLEVLDELVWEDARAACLARGANSDLVSVNDMVEVAWLLHRESRSRHSESVGALRLNGEILNVDGTTPPEEMVLKEDTKDACFAVRYSFQNEIRARNCSLMIPVYICETPLLCRSGWPCPAGWLGMGDYCYHYVSSAHSWRQADDHCATMETGARLAAFVNPATFRVLYESFSPPSAVFVGLSDRETEGEFQSVDGSAWNVTWKDGQPDNSGGNEHCVQMDREGADDVSCALTLPFFCRVNKTPC
ncbi:C-type lectin-like [Amphibalanus amphitrite]|uniref:C-type lectin-like n=1 Tax=Amphibalanus amphitrite TaxID=1232801 RepID=UPI001C904AD0|nr:C-type lectin-like [Amphibalanus amphitrite]